MDKIILVLFIVWISYLIWNRKKEAARALMFHITFFGKSISQELAERLYIILGIFVLALAASLLFGWLPMAPKGSIVIER